MFLDDNIFHFAGVSSDYVTLGAAKLITPSSIVDVALVGDRGILQRRNEKDRWSTYAVLEIRSDRCGNLEM